MDKRTISRITEFLAERLEERGIKVNKIILFGSYAHGKPGDDSDLDLAVISDSFRRKGIFKRAEMIGDAEYRTVKEFMVPIDLVTMSPEDLESETSLVSDFVKQGKVIYPAGRRKAGKKTASV